MKAKKTKKKPRFKENSEDRQVRMLSAFMSYLLLFLGFFKWAFVFFLTTLICYMLREIESNS